LVDTYGHITHAGWNLLDIVVITTGYLAFSSFGNYTAIRGVRALRPLRTITRIQELRTIVLTLLKSLPMLLDVFYLACFHMAVFGAATIQIFAGKLRGRCGAPDFSNATFEPNTGIVSVRGYSQNQPGQATLALSWGSRQLLTWVATSILPCSAQVSDHLPA
jgi:hypothetical protein